MSEHSRAEVVEYYHTPLEAGAVDVDDRVATAELTDDGYASFPDATIDWSADDLELIAKRVRELEIEYNVTYEE